MKSRRIKAIERINQLECQNRQNLFKMSKVNFYPYALIIKLTQERLKSVSTSSGPLTISVTATCSTRTTFGVNKTKNNKSLSSLIIYTQDTVCSKLFVNTPCTVNTGVVILVQPALTTTSVTNRRYLFTG